MDYYNVVSEKYLEVVKREVIYPVFKIDLLDHAENVTREITRDVSVDDSGSISVNYQQGVRRSCSFSISDPKGEFIPNGNKGIFWVGQKFKVYAGLKDIYTGDTYMFSQGVFIVDRPTVSRSSKTVSINGVDKFGYLGSELGYNQLEGTYKIAAGTTYFDAITDTLALTMGNGTVVDSTIPILDISLKDKVLPYDINKSPGQYLGDIIIEMANALGADIYYNADGQFVLSSGTTDISYSAKGSTYDFTDALPEYFDSNISYDYPSVVNVVTVVGANVNGTIVTYTAENNNPLSPTRIELIGRKTCEPIECSNISTVAEAQAYAEYELKRRSIIQMSIDFSSSLIPHLDVDKVVTMTDSYYKYSQERFINQSLKMVLKPSEEMSISASNIASLPYYELVVGS